MKRLIKILLVTSLFCLLLPTFTFANDDNIVTLKEAKKAALYQVLTDMKSDKESQWNGHKVNAGDPISVYDIYDNLISYIVNLKVDGQTKGYVEISAIKDEFPVLSFSYSSIRMDQTEIEHIKNINHIDKNINTKIVSTSPLNFSLKDDSNGKIKMYNNSGEVESIEKQNITNEHLSKKEYNKESRKEWDKLSTSDIGTDHDGVTNDLSFETGSVTTFIISNVDYQQQITSTMWTGPSGCTPTAASTLIHYWATIKGYSRLEQYQDILKTTWYSYTREQIINKLRNDMGTTYNSSTGGSDTYDSNLVPGLSSYVMEYKLGGLNYNSSSSLTSSPSFSTMKSHMQTIGPTEILVHGQDLFGGHAIVGVGTKEYSTSGHQYLIIHDNGGWGGTSDAYLIYGSHYSSINDVTFKVY
ncbi:MAG: hypothetical protein JWM44_3598 [Bacilli bacterium]|nr:hypothetical protein [Bacilli bacterium]